MHLLGFRTSPKSWLAEIPRKDPSLSNFPHSSTNLSHISAGEATIHSSVIVSPFRAEGLKTYLYRANGVVTLVCMRLLALPNRPRSSVSQDTLALLVETLQKPQEAMKDRPKFQIAQVDQEQDGTGTELEPKTGTVRTVFQEPEVEPELSEPFFRNR